MKPGEDPIRELSEILNVSREEALFYLEGFQWNLEDAVIGFFDGIVPPRRDDASLTLKEEMDAATGSLGGCLPPPPRKANVSLPLQADVDSAMAMSVLDCMPKLGLDSVGSYRLRLESQPSSSKQPQQQGSPSSAERGLRHQDESDGHRNKAASGKSCEGKVYPANVSDVKGSEFLGHISSTGTPYDASLVVQLANGIDTVMRFNSHQRIRDIRGHIDFLKPNEPKDYQLLTKGLPQRELTDLDQTIEQAGVIRSGLIQKHRSGSLTQGAGKSLCTDESTLVGCDSPGWPTTTIRVNLVDKSYIELSVFFDCTIREIRELIEEEMPESPKDFRLLTTEAQPRELTDLDQTVQDAGIADSVLTQRYD